VANEIDALLARVDDPSLRRDLKTQFDRLRQKRQFGLVFEEHLPERVMLPQHPVRRGTKVVPREDPDAEPHIVVAVKSGMATVPTDDGTTEDVPTDSLVATAEFGEPIYPGLRRLGSVDRGGDKPAHVVIKGENYHTLEALQFTHAGKVDCIYIDPPYNTGSRDWKYNNDYVDAADAWRHSKWLAMMEKRLRLARNLLKDDSVLIATIDEHEVHHLRMLLEQLFPDAYVQMVTIVVNPKGVAQGRFARVEEYAVFCFFGRSSVDATTDDFMSDSSTQRNTRFWKGLLRAGTNALPSDGLNMVYPVYVDRLRSRVVGVGDSLRKRIDGGLAVDDPDSWKPPAPDAPAGCDAVWPLRKDGALGVWQAIPETLMALAEDGFTRAVLRPEGWALSYVPNGIRAKIETGEVEVLGRDPDAGPVVLERRLDLTRAKTVWKRASHDAGWHGSVMLRKMLGERRFDFPKSLYAVRDALLPIVGNNPSAVVLDFFAGSGTTAHAVALLNRLDDGRRVSISVTNNEVSEADAKSLRSIGRSPTDEEWQRSGIFEAVTRPRIEAAITGRQPNGVPIDLDYLDESSFADGLPENAQFLELTYLDAEDIELDMAFAGIAPLLWMRAGSRGPMIDQRTSNGEPLPFAATDVYAVLFDPDQWRSFLDELPATITTVFVVTDSASVFAGVAGELPDGLDVVRLYENYLTTFAINQGGRP
jgi:adenine-specific DNA-methyltransferase